MIAPLLHTVEIAEEETETDADLALLVVEIAGQDHALDHPHAAIVTTDVLTIAGTIAEMTLAVIVVTTDVLTIAGTIAEMTLAVTIADLAPPLKNGKEDAVHPQALLSDLKQRLKSKSQLLMSDVMNQNKTKSTKEETD